MRQYLVVSEVEPATELLPVVVSAENSDDAIDKYLRKIYSKSELFREMVMVRTGRHSFAQRFFAHSSDVQVGLAQSTHWSDLGSLHDRVMARFNDNAVGEKYFAYLAGGDESLLDDSVFEEIAAWQSGGLAALDMLQMPRL